MTTIVLERETNNYWNLIKDAGNEVKLALISRLSEAIQPTAAKKQGQSKTTTADGTVDTWVLDNNKLNAALTKFHKDWGGEDDAMTIAEGLRDSRGNSRTVEGW